MTQSQPSEEQPRRHLGITRRFSLADVDEAWSDCYVQYRPAAYRDLLELQTVATETMNDMQSVAYMLDFIKGHVVGGNVKTFDQNGDLTTVDLQPNDIEELPLDAIKGLFAAVSGASLDPKDTPPAAGQEPQQPPSASSTET